MLIFLGSARLLVVLVSQLDFKRQTEAGLSDLPLSLQATQSVIAFAIMLKSNSSLHSVDISRPLLFSHQVQTHSITVVYYINMIQIEHVLDGCLTLTWSSVSLSVCLSAGGVGGALLRDAGAEQQPGGAPPGEDGDDRHRDGEAD